MWLIACAQSDVDHTGVAAYASPAITDHGTVVYRTAMATGLSLEASLAAQRGATATPSIQTNPYRDVDVEEGKLYLETSPETGQDEL